MRERNEVIFLWHDPEGGPPTWEIPEIPEIGDPSWTSWYPNMLSVRTHPREIVENVADPSLIHIPEPTRLRRNS